MMHLTGAAKLSASAGTGGMPSRSLSRPRCRLLCQTGGLSGFHFVSPSLLPRFGWTSVAKHASRTLFATFRMEESTWLAGSIPMARRTNTWQFLRAWSWSWRRCWRCASGASVHDLEKRRPCIVSRGWTNDILSDGGGSTAHWRIRILFERPSVLNQISKAHYCCNPLPRARSHRDLVRYQWTSLPCLWKRGKTYPAIFVMTFRHILIRIIHLRTNRRVHWPLRIDWGCHGLPHVSLDVIRCWSR